MAPEKDRGNSPDIAVGGESPEREEKYRRAFEACPVAISLTSLHDGRHLGVNDAWLQLFEYRREEVIGRTITELGTWRHPEERAAFVAALATGEQAAHEHEFVTRSGRVFPGLLSWHRVQIGGEPALVAVVQDLTDRKRAEAQQRLLRAILDQAAEAIIVRDATGRVQFMNPAARRMTQIEPEGTPLEQAGELWGDVRDARGEAFPIARWPISRALRGETVVGEEWQLRRPTGEIFTGLVSAVPLLNEAGSIVGTLAVTMDITERKQIERQLQEVLADREALLREVHHRTKNNLAMVASLLSLQAEEIQSAEGKAALEESHDRVRSFALLHEELYRALEGGQVRLTDYLRRLVRAFEHAHHVHILLDLTGERPVLDIDRALSCGLILNELLTNAVKHAYPGEATGEIGIGCRHAGGECELRVWDRGVGLPPGVRPDQTGSLGLRLVRILARRLSARLSVGTEDGTIFFLRFPC
jgi:PAS domain S-box-containing protein